MTNGEAQQDIPNSGHQKTRSRWFWLGIPLLLLVIAAGSWLVINTKPIPGKFRQGLNYPTYYPDSLPDDYAVDRLSFKREGNVLIFSIKAPRGRQMVVTEEHIPKGLDLSQHANPAGIPMPDEDNFTTTVGSAQTSFWGGKFVCSLVTQNTWIIINVSGFTKKEASLVAQSFRPL